MDKNQTFKPGNTYQPWVDTRISIKSSPVNGKGMFANQFIRAGDTVVIWGGTIYRGEDIRSGKCRECSASQIGEDLYLADADDDQDSTDYYLNHSCGPNVWMKDEISLIARVDIHPCMELTVDYALWETNSDWVLDPCLCGATECRRKVTGDDWKLPELQRRYKNHFTPFVNCLITSGNL